MKDLKEPSITTYHYEYDPNGNRTLVEIKDDNLTLESTVYSYDRLNRLIRSKEVTSNGLYIYEYKYDINGNLISEDRHRQFDNKKTNIRRYEYTKDNKLEAVYSGNILLVAYSYDGDLVITSTLDRDLDLNQNLNINDRSYINNLTDNQRKLINKVPKNDSFMYELTEYVVDKNRAYSEVIMERDGAGFLSTLYTYGNQRINSESFTNLSGLYTYDGRGSVSGVLGTYLDIRASYWYDGLGNVKKKYYGYGIFGSGKKYYGYNGEQYNPVTGNQNLRNRQLNIRRQRFLTEDTYLGNNTDTLSINRYLYANGNPLKYKDPSGNIAWVAVSGIAAGVAALGTGIYTGIKTGDIREGVKAGLTAGLTVGVASLTAGALLAGSLTASAVAVAKGLLVSTQVSATGAVLSTAGMAGAITHSASEKFIQGNDISITDAAMNVATAGYIGYAIGSGISAVSNYINSKTGIVDTMITHLDNFGNTSSITTSINKANTNSTIQGCKKAEVDYFESNANNFDNKDSNTIYAGKGYNPQPGEHTFKGYVEKNVSSSAEISLRTNSKGFNNHDGIVGGEFKRFGSGEHAGISPHVHQPMRNISPNGDIYGKVGTKTANGGVDYPNAKDVKQLYDYLNNSKYH